MPIKVAHVVRQYHPSVGGMEDVVQNIAHQQLLRHGQVPTVLTLDRLFRNNTESLPSRETVDGIEVIRLPYSGSSRYPLCPSVLSHVRDADVIHVHGIDFFYDFLAATRLIHGRPMVVSTHGGFFHTRFASTLKTVYFNTATRLSSFAYEQVIATSDNDGEIFESIVRAPKKIVIENGVNVEKFADKAAKALSPTLIYFGRWSENKGLIETIDFFRRLHARQPEWRLIIAGREYDHTEAELRAILQSHQLGNSVQLVCSPTRQELASLIGQSSYFICQSHHEGFGIAPIEAMSAGLTPVLSDIPPFRNLIEQAGVGVLLQTDAVDQGVETLLSLHQLGEAGYSARRERVCTFVARYDWKFIADKYVAIYQSIVDRSIRSSS
jgi:alpha-1,3-mannosyltransferase